MVIAPLDANTMGKIANGLCDNLLVKNRKQTLKTKIPSIRIDMYITSLERYEASDCMSCNEHKHVDSSFYYKTLGRTYDRLEVSNCTAY